MTQADFARLRGVSRQAVSKMCRAPGGGKPAGALYGTAALLADGKIHLRMAEAVLGPAVPSLAAARRAAADDASERQDRGRPAQHAMTMAGDAPASVLPLGSALSAMGQRILGDKERRERAQADTAEFAARRERRELVDADAVAEPQFDVVRIMRNRVLAVPDAKAEELASLGTPRAVAAVLLDALEDALRDAQADLARLEAEEEAEAARLDAVLAGEGDA